MSPSAEPLRLHSDDGFQSSYLHDTPHVHFSYHGCTSLKCLQCPPGRLELLTQKKNLKALWFLLLLFITINSAIVLCSTNAVSFKRAACFHPGTFLVNPTGTRKCFVWSYYMSQSQRTLLSPRLATCTILSTTSTQLAVEPSFHAGFLLHNTIEKRLNDSHHQFTLEMSSAEFIHAAEKSLLLARRLLQKVLVCLPERVHETFFNQLVQILSFP